MIKRLLPLISLLLTAVLAAVGVLALGSAGMSRPDHEPAALRAGAILSRLRDGRQFSLDEVYPELWDTAQFVTLGDALTPAQQRRLYAYDQALAGLDRSLLLLWRQGELVDALPLESGEAGYPRFVDALGNGDFSLARQEAVFDCAFIGGEDGRGGYYRCMPAGEAA